MAAEREKRRGECHRKWKTSKAEADEEPTVRLTASAVSDVGSDTFGRFEPEFCPPSEEGKDMMRIVTKNMASVVILCPEGAWPHRGAASGGGGHADCPKRGVVDLLSQTRPLMQPVGGDNGHA